jgi:hypothetical protein
MKLLIMQFFFELHLTCVLLRPDILLSFPLLNIPDLQFSLGKKTKFHVDIKLQAKLWLCMLSSSGFHIGDWKTNDSELKGFAKFVFHS